MINPMPFEAGRHIRIGNYACRALSFNRLKRAVPVGSYWTGQDRGRRFRSFHELHSRPTGIRCVLDLARGPPIGDE